MKKKTKYIPYRSDRFLVQYPTYSKYQKTITPEQLGQVRSILYGNSSEGFWIDNWEEELDSIKNTATWLKKKGYPSLAKIITEPKQKRKVRLHKKKDINKLLEIDACNDE